MVESEVYFVKKNEEADFVSLHNDDNITYSFLELPNGTTFGAQRVKEHGGVAEGLRGKGGSRQPPCWAQGDSVRKPFSICSPARWESINSE